MLKTINFLEAKGGVLIFLSDEKRNKDSQKDYGIGAQILNCLNIANSVSIVAYEALRQNFKDFK